MTAVALYALAEQYRTLAERLADMDMDAQTVADTIESTGITDEIGAKAQGIEMVARTMEMHGPAIDAEIERLRKLKAQRAAAAAGLRKYLLDNMQGMGMTKIETPLFKVSIRENAPAVEVYELALIPAQYMRQPEPPPPAPDKKALAEAMKSGVEIAGCRLTRGTRLEIR